MTVQGCPAMSRPAPRTRHRRWNARHEHQKAGLGGFARDNSDRCADHHRHGSGCPVRVRPRLPRKPHRPGRHVSKTGQSPQLNAAGTGAPHADQEVGNRGLRGRGRDRRTDHRHRRGGPASAVRPRLPRHPDRPHGAGGAAYDDDPADALMAGCRRTYAVRREHQPLVDVIEHSARSFGHTRTHGESGG